MPRRLQQTFHCSPLEELTHQLLFAPPAKRIEQVRRTERLHDEIQSDCPYPLDYLVYRITGYRRDSDDDSMLLVGEAVRPDLRLIIDQLSRSVGMPLVDAGADGDGEDEANGDAAAPIEQVAQQLNVSMKTVNRWRKAGLRWRWATPRGSGRKQIVIPRIALERFTEQHNDRVARATRFSTIPDADRAALVERAREMVRRSDRHLTLNQVAARLARESGRALETLRLLLEKHERTNAEQAIFIHQRGPLTPREKRVIERAHRMGVAVSKLAERFGRSRHTIHRVIRERRAAAARHVDLQHVHSSTFERDDADEVILRPGSDAALHTDERPSTSHAAIPTVSTDGLPAPLHDLYRQPTIPPDRQRSLFIRYNYLKYKAQQVRAGFHHHDPRAADLDRFETLLAELRTVRGRLVRANLPVVLSVARRHLIGDHSRDQTGADSELLELLEAGQAVLFDAVETYNATWSHAFASYLTNRLLKHFARLESEAATRRQARRRLTTDEIHERLVAQGHKRGVELHAGAL